MTIQAEQRRASLTRLIKDGCDLQEELERRMLFTDNPRERGRHKLDLTEIKEQINGWFEELNKFETEKQNNTTQSTAAKERLVSTREKLRSEWSKEFGEEELREPVQPGKTRRLRVFLYCFDDLSNEVYDLAHFLRSIGITPFLDHQNVSPNNRKQNIRDIVRSSDIILICLSFSTSKRVELSNELNLLLKTVDQTRSDFPDLDTPVIIVRLKAVLVPERLKRYGQVTVMDEQGLRILFQLLEERTDQLALDLIPFASIYINPFSGYSNRNYDITTKNGTLKISVPDKLVLRVTIEHTN